MFVCESQLKVKQILNQKSRAERGPIIHRMDAMNVFGHMVPDFTHAP